MRRVYFCNIFSFPVQIPACSYIDIIEGSVKYAEVSNLIPWSAANCLAAFYCEDLFGILQIAIPREEGAPEIITLFAKCYPQAVYEIERGANQ